MTKGPAQLAQIGTEPVILKKEGSVVEKEGERDWRFRNWIFVLNNYTEEEAAHIAQLTDCKISCGKEIGESGTHHLQGYVEFKNPRSLKAVRNILSERAHFEPSRKVREANLKYTQKEENVLRNDFPRKYIYKGEDLPKESELFEWQTNIIKILESEPDKRIVYWFYETTGGVGKTVFGKYCTYHYKNVCMTTATKSADILTCVDDQYNAYILDIPRSTGRDFSPFNAIEQLKNGFITDSKLKKVSRMLMFNPPHVIVFSNAYPKVSKLSADRWRIFNISTMLWEKADEYKDYQQHVPPEPMEE